MAPSPWFASIHGASLSRQTRAKFVNILFFRALGSMLFIKRVKRTSPNTKSSSDLSNLVPLLEVLGSSYLLELRTCCCNSFELTASWTSTYLFLQFERFRFSRSLGSRSLSLTIDGGQARSISPTWNVS